MLKRAALRHDGGDPERFAHCQSDGYRPVELQVHLREFPLSLNQSPLSWLIGHGIRLEAGDDRIGSLLHE